MAHIKGSKAARAAGRKAAETRRLNNTLKRSSKTRKPPKRGIVVKKLLFKGIDESEYHRIAVDVPVRIYIHKKLGTVYISKNNMILYDPKKACKQQLG